MVALGEQLTLGTAVPQPGVAATRMVVTDRHPSNLVVERVLLAERRQSSSDWLTVWGPCSQHKLGCVRGKATRPLEDTVSGRWLMFAIL